MLEMDLFKISLLLPVFCIFLKKLVSENMKVTGQFLFFPIFLRHMDVYPSELYILSSF